MDSLPPWPVVQSLLLKVVLPIPPREAELEILRRHAEGFDPRDIAGAGVRAVCGPEDIAAGQAAVRRVQVSPEVTSYIVDIARATGRDAFNFTAAQQGFTKLIMLDDVVGPVQFIVDFAHQEVALRTMKNARPSTAMLPSALGITRSIHCVHAIVPSSRSTRRRSRRSRPERGAQAPASLLPGTLLLRGWVHRNR
jgi:hypothetical protein